MYTNHRIDQDAHWQQFGTQPILISAPRWLHRPCNGPVQLYRVDKKPSMKANLAIYSHVVNVSGQCMGISLILGFDLEFVTIWLVFINPVTYIDKYCSLVLASGQQHLHVIIYNNNVLRIIFTKLIYGTAQLQGNECLCVTRIMHVVHKFHACRSQVSHM